ncbi:hypothetical protein Glove_227g75 [Diversispora epigaea]|uniref:Uncharacterized protein n=1 Tax=Diversispora epigaea TaxID=1348612 RepID=A0A397IGT8_9GLOM|nr:hypothetical protein Glove_227g75 [Diversispora epigaea]
MIKYFQDENPGSKSYDFLNETFCYFRCHTSKVEKPLASTSPEISLSFGTTIISDAPFILPEELQKVHDDLSQSQQQR